jgi:hypothetical protein
MTKGINDSKSEAEVSTEFADRMKDSAGIKVIKKEPKK